MWPKGMCQKVFHDCQGADAVQERNQSECPWSMLMALGPGTHLGKGRRGSGPSDCFSGPLRCWRAGRDRGLICKHLPGINTAHTLPYSSSNPTWTVLPEESSQNTPHIISLPCSEISYSGLTLPGISPAPLLTLKPPTAQSLCDLVPSGVSLVCPWCHCLIDSSRCSLRSMLPMFCMRKWRLREVNGLAQGGSAVV